jgi:hypothetical protein
MNSAQMLPIFAHGFAQGVKVQESCQAHRKVGFYFIFTRANLRRVGTLTGDLPQPSLENIRAEFAFASLFNRLFLFSIFFTITVFIQFLHFLLAIRYSIVQSFLSLAIQPSNPIPPMIIKLTSEQLDTLLSCVRDVPALANSEILHVLEMAKDNEEGRNYDDCIPGEDMDGDFDSGMASAGFGTDEDYGCYGQESDFDY